MRVLMILWLCCCVSKNSAQAPILYFNHLTTANGLSHNKINCIMQDKRGFLWIGTDDGLNRYDGNQVIIFRSQPGDTTTISGNIITGILQDENEICWIATSDGGLNRYDYRLDPKHQFRQFKHLPDDPHSIPGNNIHAMLQDRLGNLWLATSGNGLIRFNKQTNRFDQVVKDSHNTVLSVCLDNDGVVWAGREGGSILKVDPVTLNTATDPRYENLYAKLPHAVVTSLYMDSRKNIWYGSWDKILFRYNANNRYEESFTGSNLRDSFLSDDIISIHEDREGKLWLGGRQKGLQIYDSGQHRFYNYLNDQTKEGTVSDNTINCIYADPKGIVWLGTNKGISMTNPRQQLFRQVFLPHRDKDIIIYDFYKTGPELWIATSEGLFVKSEDKPDFQFQPIVYKGNRLAVTKFFQDLDGQIYLGTNYSLFTYQPSKGTIRMLANTGKDLVMNKIIESRVVSVLRDTIDGNPVLLTSPYGHFITYYDLLMSRWVSRLDTARKIISRFQLKDNLVKKFYKTRDGHVWMANTKMGLGEWGEAGTGVSYYTNNPRNTASISNDNVFDMIADREDNLWISTYGGGLNLFDTKTKKFTHHPVSNNLLEGIQTDQIGNVWMISNGNLHKYDPLRKTFSSFDLPDNEKSGGIRGYLFKDGNGMMYAAGLNYYIVFEPGTIPEERREPEVYFTDFRIFNHSSSHLLFGPKIELNHNENEFGISYAAPEYSSGMIQYSYKLEGWDKEWIDAKGRQDAQYANLSGGDYRFLVKASRNIAGSDGHVASLLIRVVPPFWKRWWFYALCAGLTALLIYSFYRYRINQLIRLQSMRNKIAQDLHDSVGSTLSSVSIYSQVARLQYEKGNLAELKDILQKIGGTSTEMISEMNDIVWTINPGNDSMEKIFQRMESYARPVLQARNIDLQFDQDPALLSLNLTMQDRKNLYLIFKEIVNNCVKYSGADRLHIRLSLRNRIFELLAVDNGRGFSTNDMTRLQASSMSGNGLNNMKRRAVEMKGSLEVHSTPGSGTQIQLVFPIT